MDLASATCGGADARCSLAGGSWAPALDAVRLHQGWGTGNGINAFALTSVRLRATVGQMKIRDFAHKGLKRLYEEDNAKGVPAFAADKLRKMLAFLDAMVEEEELSLLPTWKAHKLTGDRKGTWSLSVTGNLRMTFRIDQVKREIYVLNLEDYH